MKKLLIVESPGKIKTIKKYLGDDWEVKASIGHICDLPKKELGIDKNNRFKPTYEVSEEKKNVVKDLLTCISKVGKENVFLATDEDREGEAISFHLCRNLYLDLRSTKRVTFNEITETAIKSAISSPRLLNIPLVSAQEARRIIDRLVGYEISPVLWKKIDTGNTNTALSAGRVQSVALKLVVERERENLNFIPQASFKIYGEFVTPEKNILKANGSFSFPDVTKAKEYLRSIAGKAFQITNISKEPRKTVPQPPFSTSTLQQDANKKLKFPVSKTMEVAQKLYEAGYITYMRTDSVNLSDTALQMLSIFIKESYGEVYHELRKFKNKNDSAQEAHEAIRPTNFKNKDIDGTEDERALYGLIYLRAVASQMKSKESDVTTITINSAAGLDEFHSKATVITFDGFTRAYSEISEDEDTEEESNEVEIKENLKEGSKMDLSMMVAKQSFTKPKPRFGEAELVKELESLGIGRPSTYASIMKNIKDIRKYISVNKAPGKKYEGVDVSFKNGTFSEIRTSTTIGQANNKLIPNPIAFTLIDFLQAEFSRIMDYDFTAKCEEDFDQIAAGKAEYVSVVSNFYSELSKALNSADLKHSDVVREQKERKTIDIGEFEKKSISVGKGDHGVYVRHNDKFYNVPGQQDPAQVSLDQAIKTIQDRREQEKTKKEEIKENTLHTCGKYKIIQGQYGPYITNGKDNAPVPKYDLEKFKEYNEDKCKQVIKNYKDYKKNKGK